LKRAALRAAEGASGETKIAMRGASFVGAHPFFFDAVTHIAKLHGQANRPQVKRRMVETWDDRSTMERAILRVVQSMEQ
jgi:hypothetical protein